MLSIYNACPCSLNSLFCAPTLASSPSRRHRPVRAPSLWTPLPCVAPTSVTTAATDEERRTHQPHRHPCAPTNEKEQQHPCTPANEVEEGHNRTRESPLDANASSICSGKPSGAFTIA